MCPFDSAPFVALGAPIATRSKHSLSFYLKRSVNTKSAESEDRDSDSQKFTLSSRSARKFSVRLELGPIYHSGLGLRRKQQGFGEALSKPSKDFSGNSRFICWASWPVKWLGLFRNGSVEGAAPPPKTNQHELVHQAVASLSFLQPPELWKTIPQKWKP